MYKEIFLENIKSVLYYAYKNDLSFPRSCGLVSIILTYLFGLNKEFIQKYDINCVRGCFRDPFEGSWCDEYPDDMYRSNVKSYLEECNCHNCGECDGITPHSWIEITNKNTSKTIILDFTSIQFEDNFPDYQQDLKENYTKETLYSYIEKRSKFIITENDAIFDYYIPLGNIENYKTVINETDKLRGTKYTNSILEYLEEHNL